MPRLVFRLLISLLLIAAAVATPRATRATSAADNDPLEALNRPVFNFNDKLDIYGFEPVARAWDKVVPEPVERSIHNFFENLRTPYDMVNNGLQGSPHAAAVDFARFLTNTLFGVAGFFDVASGWGLQASQEDFGQTLGVWGVPPGPFLVLPILGPSTFRDGAGTAVDSFGTVHVWFVPLIYTSSVFAVRMVNERARALETIRNIKEGSIDYYSAVRNGYLQRRERLIANQGGPLIETNDDLYTTNDEE